MSGAHAALPCGPRHARRTPWRLPAVLVLAVDTVAAVAAGAHGVLDVLEYRCDVEARAWEVRHGGAVESAEDDEDGGVEPVEVEGSADCAGSAALGAAA